MKEMFLINPGITFLNFGSFGACPQPIFETYQNFQRELENEPVEFIVEKSPLYLQKAREALGTYLNCQADDLVCVTNPSYGVNIIAKSLDLQADEEILTTDLEYGACDRTWEFYAKKTGAKYIKNKVSLPISSKEEFLEEFKKGITPKTKLIFISHLTSSTALRLPVEEICQIARERGILSFVDGAHGPAQVPVDIQNMNPDFYVGACHKWMMAPKGSSFLYAKREHQSWIDPLVISWGYDAAFPSHSQFLDYHEMQGTRDLSAFCTIPKAIEFMEANNWNEVSQKARNLVQENALKLCSILKSKPLAPISDEFIAQMFSCEIKTKNPQALHDLLYQKYQIQIPVMPHGDKVYIRYSINAFNTQEDLNQLFGALKEIQSHE
jgi:isopenicillin-N epimerase